MKLEKRNSETAAQPQEADKQPAGKKPVVVYIMILFIAAFLLMALSFLMHQRSNTEALGQLQSSVSAMQEVQATQEKIIELQAELAGLEDQLDASQAEKAALEKELDANESSAEALTKSLEAQSSLYTLIQQYAARDYDACQATIQRMEADDLPACLSQEGESGVTPPAERYQELKEAVEAKLAEQNP